MSIKIGNERKRRWDRLSRNASIASSRTERSWLVIRIATLQNKIPIKSRKILLCAECRMERHRIASRTSSDNIDNNDYVLRLPNCNARIWYLITALTLIISITDVTCSPIWWTCQPHVQPTAPFSNSLLIDFICWTLYYICIYNH